MSGDLWASLGYLVLLLVVIGGFLVAEMRLRPGSTIRMVMAWALLFAGAIAVAGLWPQLQNAISPRAVMTGAGKMEVPIARDGHAYLTAEVNGAPIRFVVDTGASTIALSRRDARKAGLQLDRLAFYGVAQTANGIVKTAPVKLSSVSIGDFTGHNIDGVVIDGDIGTSLLGMAVLSRFARVSFEGNRLLLEW